LEVSKLYPQFQSNDRRQQNIFVDNDRRSGANRRVNLDTRTRNDLKEVKDVFEAFRTPQLENKNTTFRQAIMAVLSPIVPVRRISSLPDNIDDGNYERAAGLVALAIVNLPEDTRDLKDAAKQIFKGELPNYDYKNCQAPFSFFRGTALEPIVNKMGKVGILLHKGDIPLSETKFGQFLIRKLNIDINPFNAETTGRKVPQVGINPETGKTIIGEIDVLAYKVEGKSFSKLVGRSLLRIPVISVIALSLLELPTIIKKINDGNDLTNKINEGIIQTVKASINVSSILTGIGIVGALFARKGPAFSLLGMGIGSVAGACTSKTVQKGIDKLTDEK